jgi:hypothetical protein
VGDKGKNVNVYFDFILKKDLVIFYDSNILFVVLIGFDIDDEYYSNNNIGFNKLNNSVFYIGLSKKYIERNKQIINVKRYFYDLIEAKIAPFFPSDLYNMMVLNSYRENPLED